MSFVHWRRSNQKRLLIVLSSRKKYETHELEPRKVFNRHILLHIFTDGIHLFCLFEHLFAEHLGVYRANESHSNSNGVNRYDCFR